MKNKLARIFCAALFVMLLSIATFAGIMDTDLTGQQQGTSPPSAPQSVATGGASDGISESLLTVVAAIIETAAVTYR